uniref:USP domain-containing protein n=1 Tax=Monopterus albus TaxID=43700 RepID=A0A3Q3KKE1_MONAL
MRGLINRGTNCSINSVVQCLYEMCKLRDLIRRVEARDYRGATNGGAINMVAPMLKSLIHEMSVQEDADMVFKCIVNSLADGRRAAKKIGRLWDIMKEDSVRCLSCYAVLSSVCTKSNTIPVLLEENLPDELQEYRHLVAAPIVCVRIARARNLGGEAARLAKMEKRFAFPETLDLKHLVKEPQDAALYYELYTVVAHRSTHHCGHYVAYVRADDGRYFTNDAYVSRCSWEDVKMTYGSDSDNQGVAYMLMYRRIRKDNRWP